ncbi:multidrug and toxin extrusion protein 1-like [Lineus longissimus]|uniref:multidrug and toxin extrusion protein 1-like n=1 Tax=Lineus longissimus TaxID=88925 RepID=UPI00315D6D52
MARDMKNNGSIAVPHYGSTDVEERILETKPMRCTCSCIPSWYFKELWEVFDIAWSMVVLSLFQTLMKPVSMMFIRPYGTLYLGGIGLANTIVNVTGYKIGGGLATACDTLFSQSYGSKNKKKVGVYLQRSLLVIILCSLPCCAIHLNSETLLILMGQEPQIARLSSRYVLLVMPAVPAYFLFSILKKYLRNLNIVRPLLLVGFSGLAVNTLAHYVLVTRFQLEMDGSAIAQTLGTFTHLGTALTYIFTSKMYKETWSGWSKEAFQEWGMLFKLAIASLLMICLQFWAFEIGTLLSGTLGAVQLGAQTIIFQLEAITYMLSLGVGIACNIRVGHLLGANRPEQAKRAVIAGYTTIWGIALILISLMVGLRYHLPMLFSSDKEVIELSVSLLPILALYHIFDCTAGVSTGILRGCGRQTLGAAIIFLGTYVIGLPAGISLMLLTDLRSAGFWWGMTAGMSCQAVLLFLNVYRTDWVKEAYMAQIRAGVVTVARHDRREDVDENEDSGVDGIGDPLIIGKNDILHDAFTNDVDICERKPLLGVTKSDNNNDGQNKKLCKMTRTLTLSQLIIRRGLFIVTVLSLLSTGIFTRIYFPVSTMASMFPQLNRTGDNVTFSTGIPGDNAIFSTRVPGDNVTFSTKIPNDNVPFPAELPGDNVTFPAKIPGDNVTFPTDTQGDNVTFPAELPGDNVTFPTKIPGDNVTFPTDTQGDNVTFPTDMQGDNAIFPAVVPGDNVTLSHTVLSDNSTAMP